MSIFVDLLDHSFIRQMCLLSVRIDIDDMVISLIGVKWLKSDITVS